MKTRSIVVTLLIGIFFSLLFFGYTVYAFIASGEMPPAIIYGIIGFLFTGAMIHVTIQRIHEINKGENDDLSKY